MEKVMKKSILFLALLVLNGCQLQDYDYSYDNSGYDDKATYTTEEVAAETPPPEPVYRTLSFISEIPNADIYLDRKYLCTVPCKVKIEGKNYEMDCQKNGLHGARDMKWDEYFNSFKEEEARNSVDVDGTINCLTDASYEKKDKEIEQQQREYAKEEAERARNEAEKARNEVEIRRLKILKGIYMQ